jgi:hypothetical protein
MREITPDEVLATTRSALAAAAVSRPEVPA